MTRSRWAAVSVLVAVLGAVMAPATAAAPSGRGRPDSVPTARVGAASRSALPLVNGSLDYLDAGLPSEMDPTSPGLFVEDFDDGPITVGNGEPDAQWVHDDVRLRAMAIEGLRGNGPIAVLLAADLYMIFRPDADEIRAKAAALLPRGVAKRVEVLVTSTHNHHGPDTAFDVNHEWYDHMTDMAAEAVAEAVMSREPATIRAGTGDHWFGMVDGRDPEIIDPTMNVLQATAADGEVIATAVQWNNHPETTLGWAPTGTPEAEGRYFTADYAGVLSRTIEEQTGGEALYFVGALGGLTTPLGANVWEVTDEVGLGNQFDPPAGAVPAGGGASMTDRSFRRAVVIGEQAAAAALRFLAAGEVVDAGRVTYEARDVFTRMSHIGFRLLLVVDEATGRSALGHTPGLLYTCPALGPKNAATCEPDDFQTEDDPLLGPIRAGDHTKTEVGYLHVGSIGMMLLPGEVTGELVIGQPAGWDADPSRWFEGPVEHHAAGAAYTTPGYVHERMHDRFEWTIGLGNDELGYVIPITDWRIACVADELAGEGACAALHAAGAIPYPDAVSGEQCKAVTEDPATLAGYPAEVAQAIVASCRYGVVLGEPEDHYEETNSAGWDLAADILAAVGDLTGDHSTQRINPAFPGHWSAFPPAA